MNETTTAVQSAEIGGSATEEDTKQNLEQGVETPALAKQERDFEKDSAFAKIRRESEQAKKEVAGLKQALEQLEFNGSDTSEIIANVEAHVTGKSVDEVHGVIKERERLERLEEENKNFKEKETERFFKDHLSKIKAEFPDEKAESITEIGEEFIKLMSAAEMVGIEFDPVVTYSAIRANKEKAIVKKPPSAGSLKTDGAVESEFFTNEELDRLSKEDLKDLKILEKAKKSMKRL